MMPTTFYTRSQIEKIGNAIIFLSNHVSDLSKTKVLKLLYLLEEISIQRTGFPFFNIRFEVWKYGPVSKEIYIELSDMPDLLSPYIRTIKANDSTLVFAQKAFDDDEFSDIDLDILSYVATTFKNTSATALVTLTHRKHAPWYQTALKNGLIEHFQRGLIQSTNIEIDFSTLFDTDSQKQFYLSNKELLAFSEHLKN